MSVASVAELLQQQGGGGGGGGNFTDVVIGPLGSQVILECDVANQLLINDNTTATIEWLSLNFPLDSEIGDYSTITETTDYIEANYTNNTDLTTNFVSNATIANYSTTTETTDYLDTNYTNNTDLTTDYVAVGTLANYSTTTETTDYITANYTNSIDLANDFVASASLTDYYTITLSNTTFLGLNNYLLPTDIFSYIYTDNTIGSLNPNGIGEFLNVELPNFTGTANSVYIAYFQTCGQNPNINYFTLTCHFVNAQNSNTYVNLYYKNVSNLILGSLACAISILILN
jgi:hypothetical protein